jgi:hypothetical protein
MKDKGCMIDVPALLMPPDVIAANLQAVLPAPAANGPIYIMVKRVLA